MNITIGLKLQATVDVGSLAIIGPQGNKKTDAMVGIAIHNHYGADVHAITREESEWSRVANKSVIFQHSSAYVDKLVGGLSALAGQRQYGRECGRNHILLIDQFDYVDKWDYKPRLDLRWLVLNGARYGVLVVAAINLANIGTGYAHDMFVNHSFESTAEACTGLFEPRGQYRVNGKTETLFRV